MTDNSSISAFSEGRIPYEGNLISGVFSESQIIMPDRNCSWSRSLSERFQELMHLPIGWDGYSGKPVNFQIASFAFELLSRLCATVNLDAPSVVPGPDGSLQFEWHQDGFDIEVHVLAPNKVNAYRFCHDRDYEEELSLRNNFKELVDWLELLSQHYSENEQLAS